jgi:hypothetical protein
MSANRLPPGPPGVPPPGTRRTDSTLTWIFGTLGALLLMVIVGAALVAGLVLRHIHVRKEAQGVSIETPMGAVEVNKGVAVTGLPVYPGAARRSDGSASVQVTGPDDEGAGIAVAKLHSDDGLEAVQKWYEGRLDSKFRQETREEMRERHSQDTIDGEDADVAFVREFSDGAEVVALTRRGSGTDINLVRVGKREIQ